MNDDLQFLNDLTKEEKTEEELKAEEEQRKKNKDAEEARKRREAEQKAEEEAKKKVEEENKAKANNEEEKKKDDLKNDAIKQVEDLKSKYPELDIKELDSDDNFKAYRKGKWYKGGQTLTELYEEYIDFVAKITKTDKNKIEDTYKKKSTPKITSGTGAGGGSAEEVYSKDELDAINKKLPYMSPKEYARIEDKLENSIKYYKKKG